MWVRSAKIGTNAFERGPLWEMVVPRTNSTRSVHGAQIGYDSIWFVLQKNLEFPTAPQKSTTPTGAWEEFRSDASHAHIRANLLSTSRNVRNDDFFVVLNRKPKTK